MNKSEAIQKLEQQLSEIKNIRGKDTSSSAFQEWYYNTKIAIQKIFGEENSKFKDFTNIGYTYIHSGTVTYSWGT